MSFAQSAPSKTELQTAKTLFTEAQADETAQRWEAALEKLERAAAIKKTAGILSHIARCKDHLGRLRDAAGDYERAREMARAEGNGAVLAVVESTLKALRSRIPAIHVVVQKRPGLEVQVRTESPDGTEIPVQSERLTRLMDGYQVEVDPGDYVVAATAPGFKPYREVRHMAEGHILVHQVVLVPEPPPAPRVTIPTAAPLEREGFWTGRNSVTIAMLGAGLLATAGGIGFALASQGDAREAGRLRGQVLWSRSACAQPTESSTSETCTQLSDTLDAQQTHARVSVGFYAAGGALILGGAAVWLLWPKAKPRTRGGYVVPRIDIGSRTVGLQGAF
ncbi:hypothetical protein [Pendulispora albinea]|uniref:Tetratricopeptide repeat protein n=1 Tax=Pendulispora albinea TaxID=2741071 RepID=A0ABZ2M639_9BACT